MSPIKSAIVLAAFSAAVVLASWNALAVAPSNATPRPAEAHNISDHQALRAQGLLFRR